MAQKESVYFGRMNDPDGSAYLRGACGDEMEFYLVIKDSMIRDVRFFTDGCEYTRKCGDTAARLLKGRTIEESMDLSPGIVIKEIGSLPEEHLHCAILAVMTFQKALGDYLVRYADS